MRPGWDAWCSRTSHEGAGSSVAPPTCQMPLKQSQAGIPSTFTELLTFMVTTMCLNSRLNDRHRDKPEGVPLLSESPRA
jgi:hypothetical protein